MRKTHNVFRIPSPSEIRKLITGEETASLHELSLREAVRTLTFFFCLPPPDLAGLDDGGALSFFGACNATLINVRELIETRFAQRGVRSSSSSSTQSVDFEASQTHHSIERSLQPEIERRREALQRSRYGSAAARSYLLQGFDSANCHLHPKTLILVRCAPFRFTYYQFAPPRSSIVHMAIFFI